MSRGNDCNICPDANLSRTIARPQTSPASLDRNYAHARNAPSPSGATPTSSRRPLPPRRPDFFDRTYNSSRSPARNANQTYTSSRATENTFARSPGGISRSPYSLQRSNTSGGNFGIPGSPAVSLICTGIPGRTFNYPRTPGSGGGAFPYSGSQQGGNFSPPGGSPAGGSFQPRSPVGAGGATFCYPGSQHGGTFSIPGGSPGGTFSIPGGSPGGTFSLSRSPAGSVGSSFRTPSTPGMFVSVTGISEAYSRPWSSPTSSYSPRSYNAEEEFSADSLEDCADHEEFGDEGEGGAFQFVNPRIVYSPYRPPSPRGPLDFTVLSDDVTPIGSPARAMMSPRMLTSTPKNAPPDVSCEDSGGGSNEGIVHKVHSMWNPDDTFRRWAVIKTWNLEKEMQWKNMIQRLCYDITSRAMRECYTGLDGKVQTAVNALYDPNGFNVAARLFYNLLKRNKDLELMPYFDGIAHEKIGEIILGINKEHNADPNPEPEDCSNLSEAEMEMIAATNELLTAEGSDPVRLRPKYFSMLLEWYLKRHDSEEESAASGTPFDSVG